MQQRWISLPVVAPVASGWTIAGWGFHPLENAAFARRTRVADRDAYRRTPLESPCSLCRSIGRPAFVHDINESVARHADFSSARRE